MSLTSRNPDISKELLIDKFLRSFKEHEYVWIAWNAASNLNYSPRDLLDFFNEKHSFDHLFHYIKSTLSNLEEDEINIFISNCKKNKEDYLLNIDIKLFLKDNRLCWFLINRFASDYRISLLTRAKIFKQFNESEIYKYISKYKIHRESPDSRIYKKTNNPKVYKYISNPKILILALIYLNPKITNDINQRNIDLENYITEFTDIKKEKINLNKYINDKDFIEWSKNYIDKNFKYTVFPQFILEEKKLHQDYICAYFDDLYINNREKYINDLSKLKKAWQQNVFRLKNKENPKKKYHLPLKKESKKLLEELALFKNISESEVLERLINEAYKNEIRDEKGKALY